MAYSTQTDIEDIFGVTNVAVWSQLNESTSRAATGVPAADTARIARAITYADAIIDGRFRGWRYSLPFAPVPTEVVNWSATISGVWLYRSRGMAAGRDTAEVNRFVGMEQNALREMDLYLAGTRQFNLTDNESRPTVPVVVPR